MTAEEILGAALQADGETRSPWLRPSSIRGGKQLSKSRESGRPRTDLPLDRTPHSPFVANLPPILIRNQTILPPLSPRSDGPNCRHRRSHRRPRRRAPGVGTASTTTSVIGSTALSTTTYQSGGNLALGCRVQIVTNQGGVITGIKPMGDTIGMWQTSRCAEIFGVSPLPQ